MQQLDTATRRSEELQEAKLCSDARIAALETQAETAAGKATLDRDNDREQAVVELEGQTKKLKAYAQQLLGSKVALEDRVAHLERQSRLDADRAEEALSAKEVAMGRLVDMEKQLAESQLLVEELFSSKDELSQLLQENEQVHESEQAVAAEVLAARDLLSNRILCMEQEAEAAGFRSSDLESSTASLESKVVASQRLTALKQREVEELKSEKVALQERIDAMAKKAKLEHVHAGKLFDDKIALKSRLAEVESQWLADKALTAQLLADKQAMEKIVEDLHSQVVIDAGQFDGMSEINATLVARVNEMNKKAEVDRMYASELLTAKLLLEKKLKSERASIGETLASNAILDAKVANLSAQMKVDELDLALERDHVSGSLATLNQLLANRELKIVSLAKANQASEKRLSDLETVSKRDKTQLDTIMKAKAAQDAHVMGLETQLGSQAKPAKSQSAKVPIAAKRVVTPEYENKTPKNKSDKVTASAPKIENDSVKLEAEEKKSSTLPGQLAMENGGLKACERGFEKEAREMEEAVKDQEIKRDGSGSVEIVRQGKKAKAKAKAKDRVAIDLNRQLEVTDDSTMQPQSVKGHEVTSKSVVPAAPSSSTSSSSSSTPQVYKQLGKTKDDNAPTDVGMGIDEKKESGDVDEQLTTTSSSEQCMFRDVDSLSTTGSGDIDEVFP